MAKTTLKSYFKPSFIICITVLLSAAVAKEAIIKYFGLQMVKKPIALRKPLNELDETLLLPYEVRDKSRIKNRDVLESLGTDEYLQWFLEDPAAEPGSPTRYCSLFITYYTGTPDMVPHVPNECYTGSGNTLSGAETVSIVVPRLESTGETIAVPRAVNDQKLSFQYVLFKHIDTKAMKEETFSVQYFFHANGKYRESRTDTRLLLGSNWFSPYSYFCKVEWKFYGFDSFGLIYPDKAQTLEASRRLMEKLLPVLETQHWPDWEAANQRKKSGEDEKQVTQ